MTRVDSTVSLTDHDLNDIGSLILIQITPKEKSLVGRQGSFDRKDRRQSTEIAST